MIYFWINHIEKCYKFYFINYKINADDELALIPKIDYQITSLPTYVWIMPNGEMLHFYKGTCTPGIFMMQAKKAIYLKQ